MGRIIVLLFLYMSSLAAQAAGTAPATAGATDAQMKSAQVFVQGFYDWYTEQAKKSDQRLMEDALASKRWPMSEAIITALKADMEAQAKTPDDIVGIDFDPFLAAQDECWPYKTGKVSKAGERVRVEVFGVCANPHPGTPDVIAEIEQRGGKWMFVNFIYPGDPGKADSDLLSTLKALKEEREHPDCGADQRSGCPGGPR